MNRIRRSWKTPVSGALLLATAVAAEQDLPTDLNSTNRFSLSLRYGLNISGGFKGGAVGFSAGIPVASGRRTPSGDAYNYDNGYVLTDISGNAGRQTWYWGYDSASQVNPLNDTISFDRTVIPGRMPAGDENGNDESGRLGVELAYNYEIGVRDDWPRLHYGIEAAVNFMPVDFSSHGFNNVLLTRFTDTYGYTPGTTPPGFDDPAELPYQGSFQGPGFVINVPPISSIESLVSGATFLIQQKFDANLWGFRVGPYVEWPLSKRWSAHVSGGLAAGLLEGSASWNETFTMPGGATSISRAGGGDDAQLLWGGYADIQAQYQFDQHWGLEAGVQFQDLGVYEHNFGGSTARLDLSKSVFLHAGVSFSF